MKRSNLLALESLAAYSANVRWLCFARLLVNVRHVILHVCLACEAHRTAVDGTLEDSLVGVLTQVFAQRLANEWLPTDWAFDFHFRALTSG